MNSKIWLSSPHMSGREQEFIQDTFTTNWIAPIGPNIEGFEGDISVFLNEPNTFVTCLNSGTSAIHLALVLSGVTAGDEVVCQSMTFSATANPIIYQGAIPIFVDSEKDTWNMCPNQLEIAIKDRIANGKKPKAIIVVHLYGMPAKMDEIKAVTKKYKITLIEDAAEALGSTYKKQKCGTFSKFGILSFNGNKIITTSSGGALICNKKANSEKALYLSTQARDKTVHYQHSEIGYNYRMSNVNAAIGRGQMLVLENFIQLRQANNKFYKEIFERIPGVTVFVEPTKDFVSNHWLSCVLFSKKSKLTANQLRLILSNQNIESRPLWKPLHLQPVFKNHLYFGGKIAENLFLNGLCLPSGSNLTKKEKSRIKSVIEKAFNS